MATLRDETASLLGNPSSYQTAVISAGEGGYYVDRYGSIMDAKTADLLNAGTEGVYAADRSKFIFLPVEKGLSIEDYDNLIGNYGLYVNTEGFLVIDGDGKAWDRLNTEAYPGLLCPG